MAQTVRILAIDGEDIILGSIAKALRPDEEIEYAVTTANNAIEGLRLVRGNVFDIIFIDSVLAGMSADEALRRIRKTCPSASVVVVSGHSSERAREGEDSTGVDGSLSKPFTSSEIRSLVSSILRERKERSA